MDTARTCPAPRKSAPAQSTPARARCAPALRTRCSTRPWGPFAFAGGGTCPREEEEAASTPTTRGSAPASLRLHQAHGCVLSAAASLACPCQARRRTEAAQWHARPPKGEPRRAVTGLPGDSPARTASFHSPRPGTCLLIGHCCADVPGAVPSPGMRPGYPPRCPHTAQPGEGYPGCSGLEHKETKD